jgi:hypothetical protein
VVRLALRGVGMPLLRSWISLSGTVFIAECVAKWEGSQAVLVLGMGGERSCGEALTGGRRG